METVASHLNLEIIRLSHCQWQAHSLFSNRVNSLCLSPKFCINYYCEILLVGLYIPKSICRQNLGENRVNYGLLERTQGAYEGISGLSTKRDNLLFFVQLCNRTKYCFHVT